LLLKCTDNGFAALQEVYDTLVDLRTFVQINHSGFRKIVKKVRKEHRRRDALGIADFIVSLNQFDKTIKAKTLDGFMKRLENEPFYASDDISELLDRIFRLTSKYEGHFSLSSRVDRIC
jgi:phosphate transporter